MSDADAFVAARLAAARAEIATVGARLEDARDRNPAIFSWARAATALAGARSRALRLVDGVPTARHRDAVRVIERDLLDLAAALGIPEERVAARGAHRTSELATDRPIRVTLHRGALLAALDVAERSQAPDAAAMHAALQRAAQSAIVNVGVALPRQGASILRDELIAYGAPDGVRAAELLDHALAARPRNGAERRAGRPPRSRG
jgi:hypothetical protein